MHELKKQGIKFILFIILLCSIALAAQAMGGPAPQKQTEATIPTEEPTPKTVEYTIGIDDVLFISVWREPSLAEEVVVRPDGRISFPLAGEVPAADLTFAQLKQELTQRLKTYIKYPVVSISLRKMGGKRVIVLGEVEAPGVYTVTGGNTILEAVARAGGFTRDAVTNSVILIRGGLQNPGGRRLDLSRTIAKADMSQNVALQSEDIVYVPSTFISNVSYTTSQILTPMVQGIYVIRGVQDINR